MVRIVGLFGAQGSGKTTLAHNFETFRCLSRDRWNQDVTLYTHRSFADPMYEALAAMLGVTVYQVRRLDKNAPLEAFNGLSLRHALQTLGTEWGRTCIGDSVWVNIMKQRIEADQAKGCSTIIDDVRFDNEYDLIAEAGGILVKVEGREAKLQAVNHSSEDFWRFWPVTQAVKNDGRPDWAVKQLNEIIGVSSHPAMRPTLKLVPRYVEGE